ncbi:MAG: hypothetical protein HRU26_01965 [Psychroserpens sp.]|nr:hypothetical protein [Psychroserpens sp.]
METKKKKNTVMIWILGIFLGGMIAGFVNLGIEVFYPAPKYETYCTPEVVKDLANVYPKPCDVEFQNARDAHNQTIFWVIAPIGFLLLIIGIFSKGLLLNLVGIFSGSYLVIQSVTSNLNNKITAFVTLGMIIILIGYFAYRKSKGE